MSRIPGFFADAALARTAPHISVGEQSRTSAARSDAVVPARIVCPGGAATTVACMAFAGPYSFFPCFFQESCMIAFAGLHNPFCFSCSSR